MNHPTSAIAALHGIVAEVERDLSRGIRDMGPPANACHIREWNLAELATLLEHYGLAPRRSGLTRSDDKWEACTTILAHVSGRLREEHLSDT